MSDNKAHHRLRANLLAGYSGRGWGTRKHWSMSRSSSLSGSLRGNTPRPAARSAARPREVDPVSHARHHLLGGIRKVVWLPGCRRQTPTGSSETSEAFPAPLQIASISAVHGALLLKSSFVKPFMPKPTDKQGIGRMLGIVKTHVDRRYGDGKIRNNDVLQSFVDSNLTREEVESEALIQLM